MTFANVYDDTERAEAYATLGFPGTYYLAFRDLPAIIGEHVSGREALDFGCGAGRSTRFLKSLGFNATGIDISTSMIAHAERADPGGRYLHVADGDFSSLAGEAFDLIQSVFAFDNIPDASRRAELMRGLGTLLKPGGRILLLGARPESYTHEWASFTTREFPENRNAKSGEAVRVVMKDVADARPVVDFVWFHDDYLRLFDAAGLDLLAEYRPLGRDDDGQAWVSETRVAPWFIYVLRRRKI